MGECSFGRGFGQTNPSKEGDFNVEERVWRRIPDSIFSGMTQRYQVYSCAVRPDSLTHSLAESVPQTTVEKVWLQSAL